MFETNVGHFKNYLVLINDTLQVKQLTEEQISRRVVLLEKLYMTQLKLDHFKVEKALIRAGNLHQKLRIAYRKLR